MNLILYIVGRREGIQNLQGRRKRRRRKRSRRADSKISKERHSAAVSLQQAGSVENLARLVHALPHLTL